MSLPLLVAAQTGPILIDQTVAIVGKQALTLRDVEVNHLLNKVLDRRRLPSIEMLRTRRTVFEQHRQDLVHRELIRSYLRSTGSASRVPERRFQKLLQAFRGRFASSKQRSTYYDRFGLDDQNVELLLRDRIRNEIFMEEHLPFRILLGDEDLRVHFELHKEKRYLGKPFESVKEIVREDLRRERLKREFEKWLETEMKRTEVVLLPLE